MYTDSENVSNTLAMVNGLIFDYRKLDIRRNETIVGWTFESICSERFALEGFILNSSTPQSLLNDIFRTNGATNATIPSKNLTSDDLPVLYRLVAYGEDGHICSNKESQTAYYRFDGSYNSQINASRSLLIGNLQLCESWWEESAMLFEAVPFRSKLFY